MAAKKTAQKKTESYKREMNERFGTFGEAPRPPTDVEATIAAAYAQGKMDGAKDVSAGMFILAEKLLTAALKVVKGVNKAIKSDVADTVINEAMGKEKKP